MVYLRAMIQRILLFFTLLNILSCCSNSSQDTRLLKIEQLATKSPTEALDSLTTINYDILSTSDKEYYDFLLVKVADKAYIYHTSDSLILKVLANESKNKKNRRYAEALYYAGRVYSDLGDYPSALNYFQKAIEETPSENKDLISRIHSQTGRLLTSFRLYNQAIPHIEATLEIEQSLQDTISIIHNLILLGGNHLRNSKLDQAQNCFNQALTISNNYPQLKSKSHMYLAATKYQLGQIDSALLLIRNTPTTVNPIVRRSALGYATTIYLKAGILDTAYMYAQELIRTNGEYTEIGYQTLLSPQLSKIINQDTLIHYVDNYRDLLETYYDDNMAQLSINQQALYNYQFHERNSIKAANTNKNLRSCILGLFGIALLLVIIILYLKNRNKANVIKLHRALECINKLEQSLCTKQEIPLSSNNNSENSFLTIGADNETIYDLRMQLRNKLYSIYNSHFENNRFISVSSKILENVAYANLQILISENAELKDNNPLWKDLENAVIESSPNFIKNLQLLVGGKLTSYDLHTAILIKCGIPLSQMTILLNRSKGAIVSRRESLCYRVFDEKLGTKVIDGIIRLL